MTTVNEPKLFTISLHHGDPMYKKCLLIKDTSKMNAARAKQYIEYSFTL